MGIIEFRKIDPKPWWPLVAFAIAIAITVSLLGALIWFPLLEYAWHWWGMK